jgi:predicted transcriptional regulator of viral defense system
MMTKNIRFGPHETKLLFELEKENLRTFTFHQAKEILSIPDQSMANVLYRLKRKNRITEIEKGKYLLMPARSGIEGHWAEDVFLVVDSLLDEYYIGFLSAMYYWNLTEQIPLQVLVATTKRKRPVKYNSQQIRFITLNHKRFFGVTQIKGNDHSFKVSSLEKTIVDGLLYPQHCGGMQEVAKAIWGARDDANWSQVLKFLDKIRVSSVARRLGYILDELDLQQEVKETLVRDFQGFRWLDPSSQKKVKGYSNDWGLILNLASEELLSWRGFS